MVEEVGLAQKTFSWSHLGDRIVRNARAPPRSMFSCCFIAFDAFSREHLGHFSGHFSGWSHFLVQISELFSRSAVTFSRSNFGTFSRGCVYIFSAILGVQNSSFGHPPKNMILARIRRSTENVSLEAFLVDLCLPTVTSCNKKIVACVSKV